MRRAGALGKSGWLTQARQAAKRSNMPQATVAIVGRPNVGKSTLFNRLVGKRVALVDDRPGVTRDRREGEGELLGLQFRVMDTAGYEDEDPKSLPGRMRAQTEAAVREADVALFLIDAREGLTSMDEEIGRWLRSEDTPVIVAANKAEGRGGEAGRLEAYKLGLGDPFAISAEHGEGLVDLFEALRPHIEREEFAESEDEDREDGPLKLAIVGRPNAGKSTLVNKMLGEERMITGPEAGITRDSISIEWLWNDPVAKQERPVRLIEMVSPGWAARFAAVCWNSSTPLVAPVSARNCAGNVVRYWSLIPSTCPGPVVWVVLALVDTNPAVEANMTVSTAAMCLVAATVEVNAAGSIAVPWACTCQSTATVAMARLVMVAFDADKNAPSEASRPTASATPTAVAARRPVRRRAIATSHDK